MTSLDTLQQRLRDILGDSMTSLTSALGELTLVVAAADYLKVAMPLRDAPELGFDTLIDLCGVDYGHYGQDATAPIKTEQRFAVVLHLLSVQHNWRLRVRVFAADSAFPVLPSLIDVWPAANWFEREAFDFYGLMFEGHPDLRRILTDYGFIGHPFRKDFPLSGYVEMRYDSAQKRVIYQPITIEPREVTPRIIREAHYGEVK